MMRSIQVVYASTLADPVIGIDPTPFTAWGVLGLLVVVVLILMGIIWKLFDKSSTAIASQTEQLMEFVDKHRGETSKTLQEIIASMVAAQRESSEKVATSQDKMTSAFSKVARTLDELVLLERIYDRAAKRASGATPLTEEEIDKIVRRVRSSDKDATNF